MIFKYKINILINYNNNVFKNLLKYNLYYKQMVI